MEDSPLGADDLKALLRLQKHDESMDQLVHRREHLPGHEVLKGVHDRAALLRPQLQKATASRDEVAEQQASLEAEVASIERRIAEINARLYGSAPISPKDAQAMSEEVEHLKERRFKLEDSELEVMEALEPVQEQVSLLEAEAHTLAEQLRSAQEAVDSDQAAIDAELEVERAGRAEVAAGIPSTLLAEYERLRASTGGIAAAPLVGSSCGGCHLSLSAAELARIRKAPDSAVIHCEECGRILVRQ